MGRSAVTIPPGAPLLASAPLPDDGTLPPDTTVWLTEASG
jgi:alpha-glucosidase